MWFIIGNLLNREIATVNKNYIKVSNKLKKNIKRIQGKIYKTRKSIEREVEKSIESYPYFDFSWESENNKVRYFYYSTNYSKKRKRYEGIKLCGFKAKIKYTVNKDKLVSLANKKGKFILITNIGLDNVSEGNEKKIIAAYKKQNNIERG